MFVSPARPRSTLKWRQRWLVACCPIMSGFFRRYPSIGRPKLGFSNDSQKRARAGAPARWRQQHDREDGQNDTRGTWRRDIPWRFCLHCALAWSERPIASAPLRQIKSLLGPTGQLAGLFREGHSEWDIRCRVDVGAELTAKEESAGGIRLARHNPFTATFREAAE